MTVETIRIGGTGKARKKKVKITDGTSPISGDALFFYRLNNEAAVTKKSVLTVSYFVDQLIAYLSDSGRGTG